MFTTKDINQINKRGLTEDMAHQQISNFEKGFPYMDLLAPVSEGNGLIIFSETEVKKLEDYFLEEFFVEDVSFSKIAFASLS
mgnify:CR=1 FL=1